MVDGNAPKGSRSLWLKLPAPTSTDTPKFIGKLKFKTREYDNVTANEWVVPYNPYLSQKYNCHINIEICTEVTVVKCMYKYVYTGSDKAMFTIESVANESERYELNQTKSNRYLNARYISPVEACIRLLDYIVQGKSHSVVLLPVHLKGGHMVLFRVDECPENVLERTNHSMLTRFFELCASDDSVNQIVKTMLYRDIPKNTWKNDRWDDSCFASRYGKVLSPSDVMQPPRSHFIRGSENYERDRIPFHLDAAKTAGHLKNDGEWIACMDEAREYKMPYQLRQLFATLLAYSMPTDVRGMWNQFYTDLSEDYAHTFRDMSEPHKRKTVLFKTFLSLQLLLEWIHCYGLQPSRTRSDNATRKPSSKQPYSPRIDIQSDSDLAEVVHTENQLNIEQRAIYDQIVVATNQPEQGKKLFFIDGPGGTGKIALLRNILAKVRLVGKIAIAVASSGIASLLLMGGRTSQLKELIEKASLFIWDEAPMAHRHAFEAVDRTLRDIMHNDEEPFGGNVFALSGDFRQILPVVKKGTPADTIDTCLKS
ncbi:LOW QUALITY PROTEIN: Helitron helicase [Phytophthora megakarya]|uniref:ATP-dependent DNA helicase n=1 Tax=Phytophthora megakarya TaxID=4795 RepID=A0A225W5X2_9STRA|nr:LOW QUALITY PROTEIN: Helitron helicase [Phytophthora megakarya]